MPAPASRQFRPLRFPGMDVAKNFIELFLVNLRALKKFVFWKISAFNFWKMVWGTSKNLCQSFHLGSLLHKGSTNNKVLHHKNYKNFYFIFQFCRHSTWSRFWGKWKAIKAATVLPAHWRHRMGLQQSFAWPSQRTSRQTHRKWTPGPWRGIRHSNIDPEKIPKIINFRLRFDFSFFASYYANALLDSSLLST